jgi:hypothetical protein
LTFKRNANALSHIVVEEGERMLNPINARLWFLFLGLISLATQTYGAPPAEGEKRFSKVLKTHQQVWKAVLLPNQKATLENKLKTALKEGKLTQDEFLKKKDQVETELDRLSRVMWVSRSPWFVQYGEPFADLKVNEVISHEGPDDWNRVLYVVTPEAVFTGYLPEAPGGNPNGRSTPNVARIRFAPQFPGESRPQRKLLVETTTGMGFFNFEVADPLDPTPFPTVQMIELKNDLTIRKDGALGRLRRFVVKEGLTYDAMAAKTACRRPESGSPFPASFTRLATKDSIALLQMMVRETGGPTTKVGLWALVLSSQLEGKEHPGDYIVLGDFEVQRPFVVHDVVDGIIPAEEPLPDDAP